MNRLTTIYTTCPCCRKESAVTVQTRDFNAWRKGALAQNAFPYLSANDRERLISGICPTCWDKMFAYEED